MNYYEIRYFVEAAILFEVAHLVVGMKHTNRFQVTKMESGEFPNQTTET